MAVDPGTLTSFDLNDTTPITTNTGAVVLTLTAESLSPQGSVGGTPTVSSSDTSIATVSASAFVLNSDSTAVISDITITGVAIGTSTITVSFTDPGTVAHSVTATVTVEAPDYLDQSGLRHFWDKIKSLFIKNENGAVTTDLLANSAVTTAKINASAITNAKLATAAVQTTNILDGAVTSDKIDWRTLNYSVGFGSSTSNIILSASKQAILTSGTLPAGTYLVWGEAYWNITSGHTDAGDLYWGIGVSTNTYEVIKETIGGYSWNKGGRAYACSITLTSSNSIKLYSWRSASNGTVNSVPQKCSMLILRVS